MAYRERRFLRNGMPAPIRCMRIQKTFGMPGASRLQHYHNNIEFLYGLSGKAVTFIGADPYPLHAGDLVMIRSEALHDAYAEEGFADYLVVQFAPATLFAEEQTLAEYMYTRLFLQNIENGKIRFSAEELADTPLDTLFRRMLWEWETQSFGYEMSLRADMTEVLLHVMRKLKAQDHTFAELAVTDEQKWLITRALDHVKEHYADTSEATCAQALGVSPSYLSRIFKKGMKSSFSAYLGGAKLKEAERLLLTTAMSVTEIAEQVGFSTAAYFIASFRAHYHVTPARYRKLLRGEVVTE